MGTIKIVEWNVSKSREKKNITDSLHRVAPDIIVLTEVTFDICEYREYLYDYSCVTVREDSKENKTIIFSKNDGVVEKELSNDSHNPNWSCVQLSHDSRDYTIMGVRFRNSGLTKADLASQIERFKKAVNSVKPDVIIGDFNTNSAFSIPGKYSWSAMLTEVKTQGYDYIDACNKEASFSYQRKRNLRALNIGTCPDILFIRKESRLVALEARYHWEEDCLTDHAMLITELERFDDGL